MQDHGLRRLFYELYGFFWLAKLTYPLGRALTMQPANLSAVSSQMANLTSPYLACSATSTSASAAIIASVRTPALTFFQLAYCLGVLGAYLISRRDIIGRASADDNGNGRKGQGPVLTPPPCVPDF